MKSTARWSWHARVAVLIGVTLVAGAVLPGCSSAPDQPGGPKKGEPEKKAGEPAAPREEAAAKPEEPALPPEPLQWKPAEPAAMPEEPAAVPEPPAMKPEEPAMLPEPPGGKPAEPAAKSEEPTAVPEPPAMKPEEPAMLPEPPGGKPAEPAAKGEAPEGSAAADLPPAPKVSTFAPAQDLVSQVENYLKDFDKAVENEQEYKDAEAKIAKDANTLIVIALALGMHDQENKYQSAAGALMKAAQELADAKDYASAKKGVEAVKAAAAGQGAGSSELKWTKVAALDQLMKQVPLVNTKLKRYVLGTRFKSRAKDTAGYSAVIAAIAQGSMADTHVANSADQVPTWYAFCAQMRDAAGAVNAAIHAGDQAANDAAMAKLAQSCDDCHKVFHPAALEKTAAEDDKEK